MSGRECNKQVCESVCEEREREKERFSSRQRKRGRKRGRERERERDKGGDRGEHVSDKIPFLASSESLESQRFKAPEILLQRYCNWLEDMTTVASCDNETVSQR